MIGIGSSVSGRRRGQISSGSAASLETSPAVPHFASTASFPTHEQVAQRAYEIYAASGYAPDRSEQNWLQAERELVEETLDAEV